MMQNLVVRPTTEQPQLSLNMQGIDELFPGFALGDFAVLYGSSSIISFTSLLCVRAQLPVQLGGLGSDVVFVDGGNSFRLYQIAKLAQTHELGPKQVLDKIFISRAFTPYQLTTLLMQKLEGAIKQYNAKIVIISDITCLFSALQEYEGQRVLSQIATYLSNFARENNIIVIATYPPHGTTQKTNRLQTLLNAKASVVLSINQTAYSKTLSLNKHPYLPSGSVELPSGIIKITDFIGGSE
jgi:hypothetical protein